MLINAINPLKDVYQTLNDGDSGRQDGTWCLNFFTICMSYFGRPERKHREINLSRVTEFVEISASAIRGDVEEAAG